MISTSSISGSDPGRPGHRRSPLLLAAKLALLAGGFFAGLKWNDARLAGRLVDDDDFHYGQLRKGVHYHTIVLGDSQAQHGIDPRWLPTDGGRVYNFALAGAPPSHSAWWYESLFKENGNRADRVLYVVAPDIFDAVSHARKPFHDLYRKDFASCLGHLLRRSMDPKRFDEGAMALSRTMVYRGHPVSMLLRGGSLTSHDSFLGFYPLPAGPSWTRYPPTGTRFSEEEACAFREFARVLRREGKELVFVFIPFHESRRQDTPDFARTAAWIRQVADELEVRVIDHYRSPEGMAFSDQDELWDQTYGHLSWKGARRFTELLDRDLRCKGQ